MRYPNFVANRRVSRWFRPDLTAARDARQFVADTLSEWNVDVDGDLARLVTSELATNALWHAKTSFRVDVVQTDPKVVRIEVFDTGGRLASEDAARSLHDTGGRGLLVVSGASRRWGVLEGEKGKTVWCALDVVPGTVGETHPPSGAAAYL